MSPPVRTRGTPPSGRSTLTTPGMAKANSSAMDRERGRIRGGKKPPEGPAMAEKYGLTWRIPLTLTITNIPYSHLTWLCRYLNPLRPHLPPQIGWLSPPMKWPNYWESAGRTSGGYIARGEYPGPFDWAGPSGGIWQPLNVGLPPALHRASGGKRCTKEITESQESNLTRTSLRCLNQSERINPCVYLRQPIEIVRV